MVNNVFVQCNACKMKINLRAQIGFFDIPFHVRCPKCHSTIYGKVFVEDNNINVENADIVQCDDEEFYSVELSAEFPTRKATHKKIYEVELSPYMRNLLLYGSNEKAIEETQKTMYFANFVKSGLSEMKQNFELFWNNQDKILFARVTDMIKQYSYIPFSEVNNDFDAAVALHQLLLTTTGISIIIGKDTLGEYTKIGKLVIEDRNHLTQISEFIVNSKIDFNSIETKGFKLIELFAKVYEQLIPVIALKNGDCLENVDKNQFGIMTANFDELTDSYARGEITPEQLRDELIDTTAKAATTVYYTKAVTAILGASVNPFVPMAVYTTASYIITCTREIIRNAKLNTEEYERLTAILEESTRATKEAHAEFAKHVAQCEERQRSMLNQFIESFEYNINTGENYDESLIAIVNFANQVGFALQNVNFDDFAQAMTSHKTFRLK